ncbi:uncharacterized protein LOC131029934 isoform X2 [Cryptomeria japonica]|uniref:uncharacterized protein LOC131029934 isoform X2 n=1 Tax=Cryptomeria japonica TaxID=3369 RepID=UPI0025AC2D52|nr:uncharacterized protein LOC131029934 isoform X2 [Cryptomeria japonica]
MANCTRNLGVGKIITQITLDYFMPGMGAGSIGVNSFYVWKTCKVNNISKLDALETKQFRCEHFILGDGNPQKRYILVIWQIYGENEIINVVEFNYHHCVTSSKLSKDAKQLLHTIAYSCGQVLAHGIWHMALENFVFFH